MDERSNVTIVAYTDVRFLRAAMLLGAGYTVALIMLFYVLGEGVAQVASVILAGLAIPLFRAIDKRTERIPVIRTTLEPGRLIAGLAGVFLIFSGDLPGRVVETVLTAVEPNYLQLSPGILYPTLVLFIVVYLSGFFLSGTILGWLLPSRALYACTLGATVYTAASVVRALTLPESAYQEMRRLHSTAGPGPSVVGAVLFGVVVAAVAISGARRAAAPLTKLPATTKK